MEEIINSINSDNKIYDNIISALKEYIEKKIDESSFDKTYDAVIIDKGTDYGVKIVLNSVTYDNIRCGSFSFNIGDNVKVIVPQNNFSNAYVVGTIQSTSSNKTSNSNINILDSVYPIGSIYMSINSTNPSDFFGGTWVAWGKGRVPVCVDTGNTNFNSVEKTGGSEYLQSHSHTFNGTQGTTNSDNARHNHGISMTDINNNISEAVNSLYSYIQADVKYTFGGNGGRPGTSNTYTTTRQDIYSSPFFSTETVTRTVDVSHSHTYKPSGDIGFAGDGNGHNLQPFITCYMWKRTA